MEATATTINRSPEAPRVPGWPLIGALVPITRLGAIEFFRRAWERYGDTFRVRP